MVNNYEQNIESLTKKLKNVTGLLELKVYSPPIIRCS